MAIELYQQRTVSAQADAAKRRYHMYTGKSGRAWLVADQPDAAANIYVSDPNPNSQGFGGAMLTFRLVDGSTAHMKGPWHTNSEALLADTGIDVRDRHLTRVVVYEQRVPGQYGCAEGILYMEDKPVMGTFDRHKEVAQTIADKEGKRVFCFMQSSGGTSDGPVKPSKGAEQ